MGIDSLWPRILKAEGDEYVEKKPLKDVHTVFVDGQVMLMKSTVPPHVTTWQQFVDYNFTAKLTSLHGAYKNVILSFDNYECVPVYKSIEQLKRSTLNRKPFDFEKGAEPPRRPPSGDVWADAMQNRNYKTVVISIICKILAATYKPPTRPRALVVDFVNVIKIDYGHYETKREVMPTFQPMGESDVKFMRYSTVFGAMLIESIDSDVILIAMLFMQRHNFEIDLYIKRMASKSVDDDSGAAAADKATGKRAAGQKKPRPKASYEVINVKLLLRMLHQVVKQAVGAEVILSEADMTRFLVFHMLLTGSDYSRKMPQLGAGFVWENLHVSIPLLTCCTHDAADGDGDGFQLDADACADTVFAELYRAKYPRHVAAETESFDDVMAALRDSKLTASTKARLPDRDFARCLVKNVLWIMEYWELHNSNPEVDLGGRHGFVQSNGKLVFGLS